MLVTRNRHLRRGLRKRTISQEIKFGPLSIRFVTVIILAALVLFYLAQSTQSSTKRYRTSELQRQIEDLRAKKHDLEIEADRLKSLGEVKTTSDSLGLEPIDQVKPLPSESSQRP